jgi:hypothetical protein
LDTLTTKDKIVAVAIALVLIAIIVALFRLGLRYLYNWSF